MVGPQLGCAAVSGVRAQHLQLRSGIFHLRVRVPDDIRSLVGLTEVRRSLRTFQPARARVLAAVYAARVFEVFEMARTTELSREQVRGLMANLFKEMEREIETAPRLRHSDWDLNEQLYCSAEVRLALGEQRNSGGYDRAVQLSAQRALEARGLSLTDLTDPSRDDVLDGAARVLIERERLYQLRLSDRLLPYQPRDPLLAFNGEEHLQIPTTPIGPNLGEAIDTYLAQKGSVWTRKTHSIRCRYLGYLRQHMGDDRPLASITPADVREFRDAIARLRRNSGKAVRQTFAQKQTDSTTHRISSSTVALIFVPTQAFFRWCISEQGYVERNPAENIRVSAAKGTKGKKSRRPFKTDELVQLFSAPVFTGCQGVRRRLVSGDQIIRDAHFWIPVLGHYTGARLGELVQLHLADVDQIDGIPCLMINEDGGDKPGDRDKKHVKSEAGIRHIPLHSDVLELGFLDFVNKRKRRRRPSKRLFFEVKFGADGQASTVFSKWFGRLMAQAGLPDPALVFHSFRHNAEDALRDALQPQYVIDRIIGHSDGATSAGYGQGVSIQVMKVAVEAMHLKLRLPGAFAHSSGEHPL